MSAEHASFVKLVYAVINISLCYK